MALKVFFVNISGGEPTTHKDFCSIIDELKTIQLHFILTTNGVCSDTVINSILSARDLLIGVKISLDGPDFESNSQIRQGVGAYNPAKCFADTLKTITCFSKEKIPFTISTCLHKGNVSKMWDFVELIKQLRPISWYISTIAPSGRALANPDILVGGAELGNDFWKKIINVCAAHNIYVNLIDMPADYSHNGIFECPAATSFCAIFPDGAVLPCPLAIEGIPTQLIRFDNIKQWSLKTIWDGIKFKKFRYWKKHGCSGCKMRDSCGHCVVQSVKWFNNPYAPPPICIKNSKKLQFQNAKYWEHEFQARLHKKETLK